MNRDARVIGDLIERIGWNSIADLTDRDATLYRAALDNLVERLNRAVFLLEDYGHADYPSVVELREYLEDFNGSLW